MDAKQRRHYYLGGFLVIAIPCAVEGFFVWHPFGLRETFIYCLIIPFLVVVPTATLIVGIRGYRGSRRH